MKWEQKHSQLLLRKDCLGAFSQQAVGGLWPLGGVTALVTSCLYDSVYHMQTNLQVI